MAHYSLDQIVGRGRRTKAKKEKKAKKERSAPAGLRVGRVSEVIRRIVASELEVAEDERLQMVSITTVDVDNALQRAVVWYTTLEFKDERAAGEALAEIKGPMRKAVSKRSRLRHTPKIEFRPDSVVRSAERIEDILRSDFPSASDGQ